MEAIRPKLLVKKKANNQIDEMLQGEEVSRVDANEAALIVQPSCSAARSVLITDDQLDETPFVLEPLRHEIPLKYCLLSDTLKRIFEHMDPLPHSVIHDICDRLEIHSHDEQMRYVRKAEKNEVFFARIIEDELKREKYTTLKSLVDCLSNVNPTMKTWKNVVEKQDEIQREINDSIRRIPKVNVSTNDNQLMIVIDRTPSRNSSPSASSSSLSSKSSEVSEHDIEALFYYDQNHEQKARIKSFIDTAYSYRILLTDISKLSRDKLRTKLQSNQLPVIYILESNIDTIRDFNQLVYEDYLKYGKNRRYIPFVIDDFRDIEYKWFLREKSCKNDKPIYYKPLQLPLEKNSLNKRVELFFQQFASLNREICDKLNDPYNQNSPRYININECR